MISFTSNSETETATLGNAIGQSVQPGTMIGLSGTLGSGKTRLVQAIGAGLGIVEGDITSPTYTICVPHEGRLGLVHVDAYRIDDPQEVDELGFDEQIENGAVLVIEWVERIKDYLPPIDCMISILPSATGVRHFSLTGITSQGTELLTLTRQRLELEKGMSPNRKST